MVRAPHPTLDKLYARRVELRNAGTDQTEYAAHRREIMRNEIEIHEAARRYGEGRYTFRRCDVCGLLHVATSRGCDGNGLNLITLWSRYSVDLIHVVEDERRKELK